MCVRHRVCKLLNALAGTHLIQPWRPVDEHFADDIRKAREWWVTAQKVGEERWLTDHVLTVDPPKPPDEWSLPPNRTMLRVIEAKYPQPLPELYRTVLRERPYIYSDDIAEMIRSASLPRDQQLTLLREGVTHRRAFHRHHALLALLKMERAAGRDLLLSSLRAWPKATRPGDEPDLISAESVALANDRVCWDAFNAAVARGKSDERRDFVWQVGTPTS